MPINLREDVAYIILKKIKDTGGEGKHEVDFNQTDFTGRGLTESDFLGHLDYLNQKQYIKADFSGNAYANQEDVPSAVNPKEFDLRVANSFGAEDGPLPHLIAFEKAELTEKGQKLLEKMEQNPPKDLDKGPSIPIATKDMPFLEKVMLKGGLNDIFDARDISEVVFRTMRDMMTTEASERVSQELHEPAEITKDKALQNEIADLWKDTNPIVAFLSRVRPPLKIKSDTFLFRIRQEGSLQRDVDEKMVVKAVFSATKDELSPERIKEIEEFLPEKILQLWQEA
ncbi:DUF2267 domain-containing protein [Plectonema cf. radiosum LEGE 06105]|uniref:DUF2267 domain-containing protein n=1 Tax=Plectonema cf. radiosum LEGE 06105 TaxID=945769 RepID=A0A8J7K4P3_9CYAN|nr:DUF2267 domain-containing protein [Plectonema radiosum]MBE9216397.1 DUF2267 domain-containing protein [Plectonema cf. radiosum LEGE 06105]